VPTWSFFIVIDLLQPAHAHTLTLISRFAFDDLVYSSEVMARCSLLSEVAATNVAEMENVDRVVRTPPPTMVRDTF
jgi:hypothetical protein